MNKVEINPRSPRSQSSQLSQSTQSTQSPKSQSQTAIHVTKNSQSKISIPNLKLNDPLHRVAVLTIIGVGTTIGATMMVGVFAMPAVWYAMFSCGRILCVSWQNIIWVCLLDFVFE